MNHEETPQPPRLQPKPAPDDRCHDRVTCPVCGVPGVEKKQKWFCPRCGQLLQTCCD